MSDQSTDFSSKYKDTILLPKTEFPMKANLPATEPERIARWQKNKTYRNMLGKSGRKGKFTLPDGPPYANGNLHLGHVLNKILKDMVIKYRNLAGYRAAFIPGWDCHGLPIELAATKKLSNKQEKTDLEIRDFCRKEALHWIEEQRKQFIRLGVLADWENPYLTLNPAYEADEIRLLANIHRQGLLYRGEKPVYWCPTLQTALAAAEIEYRDHKSPSVYVSFKLVEVPPPANFLKDAKLVIWTTTPWTLPANYGIALNSHFDYGLFDSEKGSLIIAEQLKENFERETGLSLTLKERFKGSILERAQAQHPFLKRRSLVVLGDHVTLEAGTGCVHTAPGHGLDDYNVGLRYALPIDSPVDEAGRFTLEDPELKGVKIWEGNKIIVDRLNKSGDLLGFKELVHSYPHNPRTKTPLIFRATPQWFIRYDGEKEPLRQAALQTIESGIKFFPGWGRQRLQAMIENSPDWCLSRQRLWGVPIPVFYCGSCKEALVDADLMDRIADLMETSGKGIEAYFGTEAKELTKGHQCAKCSSTEFVKGKDILDVWFDSGACHAAVQRRNKELEFPADAYLEGSDQHRGWFQTSLMSSMAANRKPPFKALITHGFVNDAQGYKMSKSVGNVISPDETIKKYGAEILRLWVAHEDYGEDVTVGDEMFKRISEAYRRFRNTFRFLLGNLSDFNPADHKVPFKDMPPLDQWALLRLNDLIERCEAAYEKYEFFKVYHALNAFFAVDLSATYLDILKDRLYTGRADGKARRSSQTVFFHMTETLCSLMAPIASFLAEEVYDYLPGRNAESIFEKPFPKVNPDWSSPQLLDKFETLLEVRTAVSKVLEECRQQKVIGSSLDAKVNLTLPDQKAKILDDYRPYLREFFIVSQIDYTRGETLNVQAIKADGTKCARCWHFSPLVNANPQFPGVCEKCVEALA